jgi:glycosyltransferase involved in cell wall biosynthesis
MTGRTSPLVTVAIPTWNRAHFLREALQSVLDQSLKEIEVIVSDNASTDNTAEVVTSYRDPRLHYAPLERNAGAYRNMSRCLRLGSAPLVVVLQDDDLMLPDNLERKVRILEKYPDVDIVHSDHQLVGPEGTEVLQERLNWVPSQSDLIERGSVVVRRLLVGSYWIDPSSALMRRTIIVDEHWDESDGTVADLGLCLRLARRARAVAYISESLCARRVHPEADSFKRGTHELESSGYFPTFEEIRRAQRVKERFLIQYGHELPELRQVRSASRRAAKEEMIRRAVRKSLANRSPAVTWRLLLGASRVEPALFLVPTAMRYLARRLVGRRGRRLAYRILRRPQMRPPR